MARAEKNLSMACTQKEPFHGLCTEEPIQGGAEKNLSTACAQKRRRGNAGDVPGAAAATKSGRLKAQGLIRD